MDDIPSSRELVERAEDLVLRIRDIQSCRISTDETGLITEVHVVAATDRPPKMIARDVETCLKAELGLLIDYRKIGVVLIDPMKETDPAKREIRSAGAESGKDESDTDDIVEKRLSVVQGAAAEHFEKVPSDQQPVTLEFLEEDARVRFAGLRLNLEESRVDAEVRLEKNGLEVVGCLGALRTGGAVCKTIAGATVHALTELLDETFHMCLSGLEEIEVSGRKALFAVVDIIDGRAVRSVAGCVFIGRDPNEAAVMAVLDAVNRPLGRWKSRKEIHYTIR